MNYIKIIFIVFTLSFMFSCEESFFEQDSNKAKIGEKECFITSIRRSDNTQQNIGETSYHYDHPNDTLLTTVINTGSTYNKTSEYLIEYHPNLNKKKTLRRFYDDKQNINFELIFNFYLDEKIKSSIFKQFDEDGNIKNSFQRIITYSSNDKILTEEFYVDEILDRTQNYYYDRYGNLEKEMITYSNGSIRTVNYDLYYENGLLIKNISPGKSIDYHYDENGNKEAEIIIEDNGKTTIVEFNDDIIIMSRTFNEEKILLSYEIYTSTGQPKEKSYYDESGKLRFSYKYKYDITNRIISYEYKNQNENTLEEYHYDEYGYQEKVIKYNLPHMDLVSTSFYEYKCNYN